MKSLSDARFKTCGKRLHDVMRNDHDDRGCSSI
jgi:hypothetical protein